MCTEYSTSQLKKYQAFPDANISDEKGQCFFGTKQIHQCHELTFPDYVTYILTEIEIKGWYVVLVLLEASAAKSCALQAA